MSFLFRPGTLEPRIAPAAASFELANLDGNNGFAINENSSESAGFGREIAVGDINGDGIDDLVAGAYAHDDPALAGSVEGRVYVIFGDESGFSAALSPGSLDGENGFRFVGSPSAEVGRAVSAAGDVDNGGFADLFIGVLDDTGASGEGLPPPRTVIGHG